MSFCRLRVKFHEDRRDGKTKPQNPECLTLSAVHSSPPFSLLLALFRLGRRSRARCRAELRGSATHGRPHQQEKCCNCRATASTGVPPVLAGAAGAVGRRPLHLFCTEECRGCRWRRPGVCRGRFSAARRSGSGGRSRCRPRPSPTSPRRWTRCPARGLPDQVICPDEIQSCRSAGVASGCPEQAIRIRTRPDQPEYRGRSGFLHA